MTWLFGSTFCDYEDYNIGKKNGLTGQHENDDKMNMNYEKHEKKEKEMFEYGWLFVALAFVVYCTFTRTVIIWMCFAHNLASLFNFRCLAVQSEYCDLRYSAVRRIVQEYASRDMSEMHVSEAC